MSDYVPIDIHVASSPRNKNENKNNGDDDYYEQEDDFSTAMSSVILGTTITINESTPLMSPTASATPFKRDTTSNSITGGGGGGGGDASSIRTVQVLPGMQLRAHIIDGKANVRPCSSVKEALTGAQKRKGHYWIDIDADSSRDRNELRDWLEQLRCIPAFFMQQLAEPTWFSEVVALNGCVLAVIRILPVVSTGSDTYSTMAATTTGAGALGADPFLLSDEHAPVHLAALTVGKNLLLTFTSGPKTDQARLYDAVIGYMHQRERLPDASSSGCLVAWLRFHLDRTSRLTRDLASHVAAMDESMDRDIKSVKLEEIVQVKDQLLRLLSVAEEQQECLESLSGVEADTDGLDFKRLRGALSVLLSKTSSTERMALRLEKHIAELRSRHENHQQERINRRLAVLTVLSAIFLPLTLMTGIWGMNFAYMPELQAPDAYPLALIFMCALAVSMIYFFQRNGWFD